jgi:hypothetical protein
MRPRHHRPARAEGEVDDGRLDMRTPPWCGVRTRRNQRMDPPVRPSEELKVSSAAGRLIEVRWSVHESGRIELPRNGKTRRVDMSQQLADELWWLYASRVKETLKKGWVEVPCGSSAATSLRPSGPGGTRRRRWYVTGRHLSATEHNSGATDGSVTPRQVLVELRGLEPLTPRLPERPDHKSPIDRERRSARCGRT